MPLTVRYQNKTLTVGQRIMCEYAPDHPSSFYEGFDHDGNMIPIHVNYVEAAENGAPVADPYERKVRVKDTSRADSVEKLYRDNVDDMSRSEIISLIASTLNVSKGTAQGYYYTAKKAIEGDDNGDS